MTSLLKRLFGIGRPKLNCNISRIGRDEHRYVEPNGRSIVIYTEMQRGRISYIVDLTAVSKKNWSDGSGVSSDEIANIRKNLDAYFGYREEEVEYQ